MIALGKWAFTGSPHVSGHADRPVLLLGSARLCCDRDEAKDSNDGENKSQSPDKDGTKNCSTSSETHVEGEMRQHCAHNVASRAIEEQREE